MSPTVVLTVTRADNELIALLNGNIVYNKTTENNPEFSDVVNLTSSLIQGNNVLTLLGINWGGGAVYQGTLTIDSTTTPWGASYSSTANGLVWSQVTNITAS
jgi:hypothetical protein